MGKLDPILPSPSLPPGGKPGGVGEKAENSLLRFAYRLFDGLKDQVSDLVRNAVDRTLENLEKPLLRIAGPTLDRLLADPNIPDDVRAFLQPVRAGEHQVGIAVILGALVAIASSLFPAAISGFTAQLQHASYKIFSPGILDVSSAIRAHQVDPANYNIMMDSLLSQGLNDGQIAALQNVSKSRLGVFDAVTLWQRGEISESELSTRVAQAGGDLGVLPDIKKLAQQIPGPSDLVRMGVREAFNDSISTAYGYDSAFPADLAQWMKKQGYDPMWAKYYWRAHWELPSAQMGMEMLHRGEITLDELRGLLRALDIAPGWIERIIAISYNTYTRVDTRRMYAAGVLSEADMVQSYIDQGYPPDKAAKMAAWTIKDAVNEEAGLTRASVKSSYAKGRLSRNEALDLLERLGTAPNVADFILEQADLDREDELLDREIATIGKRFKNGQINESEAYNQLGQLGVQGKEVQVLVDEWRASMSATVKRPTKADLERFFEQGVLDLNRYRSELSVGGYDDEYIGWYVASLSYEAQQERYDQAEKARKEAERVDALRKKTALQTARAELDLQIAEINATIADAQVALVATTNERDSRLRSLLPDSDIARIKLEHAALLNESDAAIAQSQLKISQLNAIVGQARTRIAEISVAIAENRDYALETQLRQSRLGLQTDQARLNAESKQRQTEIARLKEQSGVLETEEQVFDMQQSILTLQREIAERNEQVAAINVQIEEIDEQLPATLSTVSKAELQAEQARLNVTIRENESLVDALQTAIRQAQADRLAVEQEIQAEISALPSRGDQIEIQALYATQVDEIEARIAGLRARIRELQVEKSRLNVGG